MQPIKQTMFFEGFENQNPVTACIASIFDTPITDLPHYESGKPFFLSFATRVEDRFGYRPMMSASEDIGWIQAMGIDPDFFYIAYGMSPRNTRHAVVRRFGVTIHDPHPTGKGLETIDSFFLFKKR